MTGLAGCCIVSPECVCVQAVSCSYDIMGGSFPFDFKRFITERNGY